MSKKFWKIMNQAEAADILLYGEIASESWYDDDVTPKMFADELAACGGKPINVRINSMGGDVFAAQSIYTAIRNYPGAVSVYIDGVCASAATIIASAGDRVYMPVNAIYMIHNPSTFAWGDARELRHTADTLDTVKQTIVNVYTARSRILSERQVKSLMDSETWMAADEALEKGFVDEIVGRAAVEQDGDAVIVNSVRFDLHKYRNATRAQEILSRKEESEVKSMDNKTLLGKIKDLLDGKQEEEPKVDPVQEERSRIAALDAARTGNRYVDAIIETAKTQGQTMEDIRPYVDAMPKDEPKDGGKDALDAIRALLEDHLGSGAGSIAPSSVQASDPAVDAEVRKKAAIDAVVNYANGGAKK